MEPSRQTWSSYGPPYPLGRWSNRRSTRLGRFSWGVELYLPSCDQTKLKLTGRWTEAREAPTITVVTVVTGNFRSVENLTFEGT